MSIKIVDYRVEECLKKAIREEDAARYLTGQMRDIHIQEMNRWIERAILFEKSDFPQIAPPGLTPEGGLAWRKMRDGGAII